MRKWSESEDVSGEDRASVRLSSRFESNYAVLNRLSNACDMQAANNQKGKP